jgi:1,4-alpha-glucan branching enzyme
VDVPGAKIGHEYRYRIINNGQVLNRVDPYARQVTNSVGNGVIHDSHYDWGQDKYTLPPWNELVIYELHIGTFHNKMYVS